MTWPDNRIVLLYRAADCFEDRMIQYSKYYKSVTMCQASYCRWLSWLLHLAKVSIDRKTCGSTSKSKCWNVLSSETTRLWVALYPWLVTHIHKVSAAKTRRVPDLSRVPWQGIDLQGLGKEETDGNWVICYRWKLFKVWIFMVKELLVCFVPLKLFKQSKLMLWIAGLKMFNRKLMLGF